MVKEGNYLGRGYIAVQRCENSNCFKTFHAFSTHFSYYVLTMYRKIVLVFVYLVL